MLSTIAKKKKAACIWGPFEFSSSGFGAKSRVASDSPSVESHGLSTTLLRVNRGGLWLLRESLSWRWKCRMQFQLENLNSGENGQIFYSHPTCDENESESRSVVSDTLRPQELYSPWNSPGQNTGVGSLSLLQGNLPNPGIEPGSPTLQVDSYQLSWQLILKVKLCLS